MSIDRKDEFDKPINTRDQKKHMFWESRDQNKNKKLIRGSNEQLNLKFTPLHSSTFFYRTNEIAISFYFNENVVPLYFNLNFIFHSSSIH